MSHSAAILSVIDTFIDTRPELEDHDIDVVIDDATYRVTAERL